MIGRALKIIRKFNHVKQKEFAASTGLSPSYVSEIENEIKEPTIEVIQKYSERFDIPMSSILFFSEQLKNKKFSEKVRLKSADKILKMLEWIDDAEDEKTD
ncbi:MAG: XRE family transcriptional regulator [Alphaproteobacteria bacterium]|nr:MAG: XRE family transcriptional regulator [Alphaproteobacteria bacterium]